MAADEAPPDGQDPRVRELPRVNAELAAEIRNLAVGSVSRPRSSLLGATRRLTALTEERDEAVTGLEAQSAELEALRLENEELRHRAERQVRELERLRVGPRGLLRRAKAGLLRRRSNRGAGA
jgi:hypothetical protein